MIKKLWREFTQEIFLLWIELTWTNYTITLVDKPELKRGDHINSYDGFDSILLYPKKEYCGRISISPTFQQHHCVWVAACNPKIWKKDEE